MKEHKKIEQLMLFSEVAEHLSFTTAAKNLNISRGHLSSLIRKLEKDMGMPLLIRSTRSVRLTGEGERVLSGMKKIRHDLLALERSAEHEGKAIEGLIKITAPVLFTKRFLLEILPKFTDIHPAVEFSVDCSYTAFDLNRSDFDLAFRATNQPPQNMIAKQLITYQHCCCASPGYFNKHGIPQSPKELKSHQCLKGKDQSTWHFINEQVQVKGWLEVNDNHMLKSLALRNDGIIRVPKYLVDKEILEGSLIQIFESDMPVGSKIFMVHPQLINQSKRLTAFINFTRQYFKLQL
jgi:DNA-binding transcriptional LysR family regulator